MSHDGGSEPQRSLELVLTLSQKGPDPRLSEQASSEQGDPVAAAKAMLRQGDNQGAIALLTSLGQLTLRAADCLCDAWFQEREWTKSLQLLRAMLQNGLGSPYRRRLEGKLLSNLRRYDEALACVQAWMAEAGPDQESLVIAKTCCFHLGRHEEALRYGQQVMLLKDQAAGPGAVDWEPWPSKQDGRCVIAYSVWGSRPAYLLGAAINIQLARTHFQGWDVRIYAASDVGDDTLALYRGLGAEVVLADKEFADVPNYFWRFLVADDPEVSRYLCRDADARLGSEEAGLVAEWKESGLPFHVVRDHPLHDDLMLAGLWGGTATEKLSMRHLMNLYFRGQPTAKYGHDQRFLGKAVWPLIRSRCFVHDRCYSTPGVASHPHSFNCEFGAGFQNDNAVFLEAQRAGLVR